MSNIPLYRIIPVIDHLISAILLPMSPFPLLLVQEVAETDNASTTHDRVMVAPRLAETI